LLDSLVHVVPLPDPPGLVFHGFPLLVRYGPSEYSLTTLR